MVIECRVMRTSREGGCKQPAADGTHVAMYVIKHLGAGVCSGVGGGGRLAVVVAALECWRK